MTLLKNSMSKTYFITTVSILSSLSAILFYIGGIPIFPGYHHLKIDMSDIPALVGAIIISPGAGIIIELIKSLTHLLKTSTFGLGELISFIIGSTCIISFTIPFHKLHNKKIFDNSVFVFIISYIISICITCLIGIIVNIIFYPIFLLFFFSTKITLSILLPYLLTVLIMNFIKTTISILLAYMIYKILKIDKNNI